MTRRASVLNEIEPFPVVDVHPGDLSQMKLEAGQMIRLESRRGKLKVYVRATTAMQRGEVFLPFCYVEAAANLLTNEALDPYGKIPEFKYCAVKLGPTN
jgi:formate dehydrogenase major subunit